MKIYPFPKEYKKKSDAFKVWADGCELDVYSCDVSAYPFNRVWEGVQRDKRQTEQASFVMLGEDGNLTLEIEPKADFKNVIVRPLSKNVTPEVCGNKIKVNFSKCGQYSIEFDNMHNVLTVFINSEKEFEINKKDKNVLYFGKGVHIVDERIELNDNQTIFIDEGAVLFGSINATEKKNIKVVGYGILDNSRMRRANEINGCAILDKNAGDMTGNPFFFSKCENIVIDGITVVDSSGWNMYFDGCENIIVNNIKIIGQWRYNADGCDFCNCSNSIIKNSFLRTFDDCVTVKGFKLNNNLPIQNILTENCTLWCDWGKALEVGAETCAPYISSVTFRNCDIIHGSVIMLDIQQGDGADIDNVVFEDIRIEYSGGEMKPAIESNKCKEYPHIGVLHIPIPFSVKSGLTMWSIDDHCGDMKNVYFKNINILADEKIEFSNCNIKPNDKSNMISDVYFENIMLNSKKFDFDKLGLEISELVNNIFFDGIKIK